ncbi:unnamed protein product [Meloidogyne enterolobii]|uniref:Uncharacterized protein n=1 Tax=Meloidogyne enterolobii TaxID=390850 RepID=A0ACB0YPC3_MELEN
MLDPELKLWWSFVFEHKSHLSENLSLAALILEKLLVKNTASLGYVYSSLSAGTNY